MTAADRAEGILDQYEEDDPEVRRALLRKVRRLERLPPYDAHGYLDELEAELRWIDAVVADAPQGPF